MDDIIDWKPGWGPDLYDDGVITYKAPKGFYRRAFSKLERKLGIETRRVRKEERADIICKYKEISLPYAGWHFRRYDFERDREFSQIEVKPNKYYTKSTIIHEIGHALGLGHPENHSRTDTIMSYGADRNLKWFTEYDCKVLNYLY